MGLSEERQGPLLSLSLSALCLRTRALRAYLRTDHSLLPYSCPLPSPPHSLPRPFALECLPIPLALGAPSFLHPLRPSLFSSSPAPPHTPSLSLFPTPPFCPHHESTDFPHIQNHLPITFLPLSQSLPVWKQKRKADISEQHTFVRELTSQKYGGFRVKNHER